jgi:hypothetical protein
MNLTLIAGTVAAAIGFGLAWQLQERTILTMQLEQSNERIAIQRTARQNTERYMSQISTAQAATASRVIALRRDADLAGTELDGLREQTAASLRAATESAAACLADATAKTELLALCAGRYSGMAATADSWRSDAMTLVDAWPK